MVARGAIHGDPVRADVAHSRDWLFTRWADEPRLYRDLLGLHDTQNLDDSETERYREDP